MLTNGEIYTAYIAASNQTLRPQDERIALNFARAIEAAVLEKQSLAQKEAQQEPIKPIRTQTIISPAGVETITATYQLFTPRHRAVMEQALSMLDFINENGYRLTTDEQERIDAAIAAIRVLAAIEKELAP